MLKRYDHNEIGMQLSTEGEYIRRDELLDIFVRHINDYGMAMTFFSDEEYEEVEKKLNSERMKRNVMGD